MTNVERGMIIIDTFSAVYEMVQKIQGKIKQCEGLIAENPECGTVACIGGWLAYWYGTTVDRNGCRHFDDGFRRLAEELCLDLDQPHTALKDFFHQKHERLWPVHTDGCYHPATDAYESGWDADLEEIIGTFLVFGFGLVAEYGDSDDEC